MIVDNAQAPAPVHQPATPVAEKTTVDDDNSNPFWFDKPKPRIIPRAGMFPVLPSGPGYYSVRDLLEGNYRDKPPSAGYPRFCLMAFSFFDGDWRFVDSPSYTDNDLLDRLHRVHLGDDWLFSTGGEFRWRHTNEINSRVTGNTNNFDLTRLRVFGDLWYRDTFRIYAEFISAQTFNQDLAPAVFDRNYADILNLFVDVKVFQPASGDPVYLRVGRQELLFGSQRLITTLEWANTRRTFQGVRGYYTSDQLDVDLFWTQPVIPNPTRLDSVDDKQNFAGAWTTYRPSKNQAIDLYYLYLDNQNQYNAATKTPASIGPLATAPYDVHTLGYRWFGNQKNLLLDSENMLQLGRHGQSDIVAGASSTGLGYNFAGAPMNPTVWAYFDWASGSRNPNAGQFSTFNQLYPFGHLYLGWVDLVGRQNVQDWNTELWVYPTKWLTFNAQYHVLRLDSATDYLYNTAGVPTRYDPTGKAGRSVGQEVDLILNFHLSAHQDVLVAYGHVWAGRFLKQTGSGRDPESFWLIYNFRW